MSSVNAPGGVATSMRLDSLVGALRSAAEYAIICCLGHSNGTRVDCWWSNRLRGCSYASRCVWCFCVVLFVLFFLFFFFFLVWCGGSLVIWRGSAGRQITSRDCGQRSTSP